jgi:ribose transport system permease protein
VGFSNFAAARNDGLLNRYLFEYTFLQEVKPMKKLNIKLSDIVPFIAFIVIFAFFTIASGGRMLNAYNLRQLLNQSLVTIIVGCGMLFVVAQGSIDLSVGVNLALSGVIATYVSNTVGAWAFIPCALIVGGIVGVFNGIVVSRFKVSSFMLTIAMLIGLRGVINFIQSNLAAATGNGAEYIPASLRIIASNSLRIPLFLAVVAIMAYIFEFTKLGRYSKAIGENETAAKYVGVPVKNIKFAAFVVSGILAGVGAIFSVTALGGTSQTMGVFLEMQVAMAIFLGGVLVTGGTTAKIYKVVLGSLSITLIVNGLAVIGKAESHISQSVEGILLIAILFITILVNNRRVRN